MQIKANINWSELIIQHMNIGDEQSKAGGDRTHIAVTCIADDILQTRIKYKKKQN